jgi:hypothetical protein
MLTWWWSLDSRIQLLEATIIEYCFLVFYSLRSKIIVHLGSCTQLNAPGKLPNYPWKRNWHHSQQLCRNSERHTCQVCMAASVGNHWMSAPESSTSVSFFIFKLNFYFLRHWFRDAVTFYLFVQARGPFIMGQILNSKRANIMGRRKYSCTISLRTLIMQVVNLLLSANVTLIVGTIEQFF